jgi:hypothetical protein
MTVAVSIAVLAAIALPHLLPLSRIAPILGASIWLFALALRALAGVFLVIFVVFFLPATRPFELLTHWCWHAVLPLVGTHLPLEGHRVGDTATLLPGLFLALSTVSLIWALARTARGVRSMLRRRALSDGPMGSVIVPDGEVLVAVAGVRHPTVMVSAGALCTFDDEELAASVDHERGHIARHHRFVLVIGELCWSVGRFVPGGAQALAQLQFHLERDADEYALARRHDPLALASAICKAGGASTPVPATLALDGDGNVVDRLRLLMSGSPRGGHVLHRTALFALAGMGALILALGAALPGVVDAGAEALADTPPVVHCHDHHG